MSHQSDQGHRHQHRHRQSQVAQRQQAAAQQNQHTEFATMSREGAASMKPMGFQDTMKARSESFNKAAQLKSNHTGLPNQLKSGIENLSGYSMDDVNVHYNSAKPAQLNAHAYAQGTDIHVAAGQEKHLPHEAWHVVQQKQGRVQPTTQMKGKVAVNDNAGLEQEADVMGAKAQQSNLQGQPSNDLMQSAPAQQPVTQGYFMDGGKKHRVADDLSVATKDSNPWNRLYAKPGKAAASNNALKAVGASIELKETSTEKTFSNNSSSEKLKQIEVKNKMNNSKGDTMDLYADCGRSNSLIVGSLNRTAVFQDKTNKSSQTTNSNPEMMKYEIMLNHFKDKISNAGTILASISSKIQSKNDATKALEPYTTDILDYHKDMNTLKDRYFQKKNLLDTFMTTYNTASTEDKKKLEARKSVLQLQVNTALNNYNSKATQYDNYLTNTTDVTSGKTVKAILNEYFTELNAYNALITEIMKPYNALSDKDRDDFDKKIGINKYANPSVGHGYTISSGGEDYAGENTWNFHWGGVVMESNDRKDKVVLENYSENDWDKQNNDWDLKIYGTEKKGQSFHEQHEDTQQHGKAPTTMEIKKQ